MVDKEDNVIRRIDKWTAHKTRVLHRAFTVCLFFKDQLILQHRKHPVFDGVYDLTCSSHPYFKNGQLQEMNEAVLETLKREWNVKKTDLISPINSKGSIYYKAKDPLSIYWEHEICYLFVVQIKRLPTPNFDFTYGFSLFPKELITNHLQPITKSFAPWVPPLLKLL